MLKFSLRSLAIASLTMLAGMQSMPAVAQSEPFIGQIMCAGYSFAPRGWALLDGQLLPISQNTALFSLLGTQFGGNGQTTFGLPDMRGRALIGVGQGPGLSPHDVGEMSGSENTTLLTSNLPPHAHTVAPLGSSNDATSISPAGKVAASKARTTLYADPTNLTTMAPAQTSVVGSGVPVNNMQPYLAVNCYIALQGIYPSRN